MLSKESFILSSHRSKGHKDESERSRFRLLGYPVRPSCTRHGISTVALVSPVILVSARAMAVPPGSVMTLGAGVWWGGPSAPGRPDRGGEPPYPRPVVLSRGNANQNRHCPQDSALWVKEDACS